ncbi:MAG: mechanosensitive ion channel family protein [Acutalibacteraceae bacterium]
MKKAFLALELWQQILIVVAVLAAFVLVVWLLTRLNKRVFRHIQKRRPGLHVVFFERLNSAVIVLLCLLFGLSAFNGAQSVWQTLLGSTALISAVLAFVAQDVIKDILAGLMLSVHKPFEIGDRIVLEDGTPGIVENITMRHVVLVRIDTLRVIVPNSKLNAMAITNYSHDHTLRSVHFRFNVGYESDMDLCKQVIAKAIHDSAYSRPGRKGEGGKDVYSPVYFLEFADSALVLAVTVYYEKSVPTERVIDDINTRVRDALRESGVEIPYNYINVVTQ